MGSVICGWESFAPIWYYYSMSFIKKSLAILLIGACFLPGPIFANDTASQQAQLQQQLQQLQNQIAEYQKELGQVQGQKNTLQNKIKTLQKQQSVLQLQIQQTNLKITDLGKNIESNTDHAQQLQDEVAQLIRVINRNDDYPFLYVAVSQQKLSDIFSAYEDYSQITKNLSDLADDLKKTNLELAGQQEDAQNLLSISEIQQGQLQDSVSEQNNLLVQTKGQESNYQAVISDTKKQAAEIANRIYQLSGITTQVTFAQALEIARWAQGVTGIEPAYLLAVLTQESNLGQNVGTCNRAGDPPSKSYKVVMKPDRDIEPFLEITSELGLDPDVTPISCPLHDKNGKQQGWGGAMGPAQFIPSTWMGYKDKVASLNGKGVANPWDIRDAFAAAAVKLVAGGADGTQQGEWNAAMRYFSGSTNVAYRFYGDSVMNLTAKYQDDISSLNQ